jgi:hypothetical protein
VIVIVLLLLLACGDDGPPAGTGDGGVADSGAIRDATAPDSGPRDAGRRDAGMRDAGPPPCEPMTCEDLGASCGMPDDGCGDPLDCGSCGGTSVCASGACECAPDEGEPNGTRFEARSLGSFDDSADPSMTFSEFTVHATGDEDWYVMDIVDGFDAGNPVVRVELSGIPAGDNYDLAAYFVCTAGTEAVTCGAGMPDNMIGNGCASASSGATSELVRLDTDCSHLGTDDSGTAYVVVTPRTFTMTCEPYTLGIAVN